MSVSYDVKGGLDFVREFLKDTLPIVLLPRCNYHEYKSLNASSLLLLQRAIGLYRFVRLLSRIKRYEDAYLLK